MNKEPIKKGLKIKHSFLILFLMVLITFLPHILLDAINVKKPYISFINYLISFCISVYLGIKVYERFADKFTIDISTKYLNLIPILIPIPILFQFGLTSHLVYLIPMPESIKQAFYELGNDYSWTTLFTIMILAPILEEVICRGIILKGLLKNYSPFIAILVSSTIFGIMHLNPWQFIGAFGIGLINGWVFWKTKNIIIPIVIHLSNNLFFTIFGIYFGTSYLVEKPMREVFGSLFNQIFSILVCLVLLGSILFYLKAKFQQSKN
jgi:membrane protease YdiL (CAAX protease family)